MTIHEADSGEQKNAGNFRKANEILRPDYSNPDKPAFPSIRDVVESLSREDIIELTLLYDVAHALESFFAIEPVSEKVDHFVLTRVAPLGDDALDGGIFASIFGIYSGEYEKGVKYGTITELRTLLSDNGIAVRSFVDSLPMTTVLKEDNPEDARGAESILLEHLQVNSTDAITDEDVQSIGYEILQDYEKTAYTLVAMMAFAKNWEQAIKMQRKAEALAKAGGFELKQNQIAKSYVEFYELSLEKNLSRVESEFEGRGPFAFPSFGRDGTLRTATALNNALIAATFLGQDTSFVRRYFGALMPSMIATIRDSWKEFRMAESSKRNTLVLERKYNHNRMLFEKLAKVAGIEEGRISEIINRCETVTLNSNN